MELCSIEKYFKYFSNDIYNILTGTITESANKPSEKVRAAFNNCPPVACISNPGSKYEDMPKSDLFVIPKLILLTN